MAAETWNSVSTLWKDSPQGSGVGQGVGSSGGGSVSVTVQTQC